MPRGSSPIHMYEQTAGGSGENDMDRNTGRIHEACDVGVELKLKSLRSHRMYMMVNKLPLLTSMHVINRLSWGGFLLRIPLPGTLVVCADAFHS